MQNTTIIQLGRDGDKDKIEPSTSTKQAWLDSDGVGQYQANMKACLRVLKDNWTLASQQKDDSCTGG